MKKEVIDLMKTMKLILVFAVTLLFTQNIFAGRYYDASTGRFLTVDKLANKFPAWSPYNYALDNPLKYVDPDGNQIKNTSQNNYVVWVAWSQAKSNNYKYINEGAGLVGPGATGGGTVHDFAVVYNVDESGKATLQTDWAKTKYAELGGTWNVDNDGNISTYFGNTIAVETMEPKQQKGIKTNNLKTLTAQIGGLRKQIQGQIKKLQQKITNCKNCDAAQLGEQLLGYQNALTIVNQALTDLTNNSENEKEEKKDDN